MELLEIFKVTNEGKFATFFHERTLTTLSVTIIQQRLESSMNITKGLHPRSENVRRTKNPIRLNLKNFSAAPPFANHLERSF